jgi:hypothetical protein
MDLCNANAAFKIVRHADLKRVDNQRRIYSLCPTCGTGVVVPQRVFHTEPPFSHSTSTFAKCILCGQGIFYEDAEIDGEKLVSPIPLTFDETMTFLDKMLVEEDRATLQSSQNPDGIALQYHPTLGQHLRNIWGLWQGSPLARHFKEVHRIEHPDDMSGLILRRYARAKLLTRYQMILAEDD